jgi:acyl carrier protein
MEQNSSHDADSVALFKTWLIDWMAQEMGIDREKVDSRQSFLSYGMDSVQAMTMVGDLEAKLEVRLSPTLAWDYPDINSLSAHLGDRFAGSSPPAPPEAAPNQAPLARIEALLGELDSMSDRDVEGRLNQCVENAS